MLSGTAQYALRAVLYLAERGDGPVGVGHLARTLGVPKNYLSKILHRLVRARILRSARGRNGGFELAVAPARLRLLRVVALFDDLTARRRCLLGRRECGDRIACPVHWRWKRIAEQLAEFFRATTVADLLRNAPNPGAAGFGAPGGRP